MFCSKNWKDAKLIHGGKCPAEFSSSCFNNDITYYFPICVQDKVIGPTLNAPRNRPSCMSSRFLKGFRREIKYKIGIIFKNTLSTLLMSLLEIVRLLLLGNSMTTLRNIGRLPPPIKNIKKTKISWRIMGASSSSMIILVSSIPSNLTIFSKEKELMGDGRPSVSLPCRRSTRILTPFYPGFSLMILSNS